MSKNQQPHSRAPLLHYGENKSLHTQNCCTFCSLLCFNLYICINYNFINALYTTFKLIDMKKMIQHKLALMALISAIALSGCMDKDYYEAPDYGSKNPSQLEFSTTQDVQLKLNYNSSGLITTFEVYAENPYMKNDAGYWTLKDGIAPIAAGINTDGLSEIFRTIPAYVNELYVYSSNLFVSTLKYAKIENGVANFEDFDISAPITEEAISRSLRSGAEAVDLYLKQGTAISRIQVGSNYCYRPTPDKNVTFPQTVKNAIESAFPNGQKADAKFYTDASIYIHQEDVKDEGAEIWVSVISSDGEYNNSLSYFCYDGPKEDLPNLTNAQKESLKVICAFQYAKLNNSGLKAGEYIQLKYYNKKTGGYEKNFPVGTTIGWVLTANGFNTTGSGNSRQYFTYGAANKNWFYSIPAWNPEKSNKNHTITFTATDQGKDYICFGFEDCHNEDKTKNDNEYNGDGDCNDVMFHIISNPIKAVVPPPHIPEEGTVETTETKKGILAFEDFWPKKFDYDLNDVVVKYESEITYVQKTKDNKPVGDVTVNYLTDKLSLIHAGADKRNAFSYKVNIPLSSILKVTVNGDVYNPIADGNGFIIDLCPDVNSVIEPYITGTTPKVYNISIALKEGTVLQDNFNREKLFVPYNPFIFSEPGKEIHLPSYAPTSRVNMTYFGTDDDASNPNTGVWYVSNADNAYPFALHLSNIDTYRISDEGKSIETTYPEYTKWVNNGCGSQYADWYLK